MFKSWKKSLLILAIVSLSLVVMVGCGAGNQENNAAPVAPDPTQVPTPAEKPAEKPQFKNKKLILATTTSTKDTGLLDEMLPIFEEQTGLEVDVISVGTGQAIAIAEGGDADVILVHARASEDKFVEEGYGVNRRDVMYNDFVIIGPKEDPLGIKGMSIEEGFAKFPTGNSEFISRGDDSGTHKKELQVWKASGVKNEGNWYLSIGKGMGDTINMANEKGVYTMTDRGTYLAMKDNIDLEIIIEGDADLLNPYGVIPVNPDKHSHVNYEGAEALAEFLTSKEGRDLITGFKVGGEQLFFITE